VTILRLRPYEYIYYNSLAGGTRGGEGLFVHDYWCTSIREAMAHVNSVAPRGTRVAISAPPELAAAFARPDLELVRAGTDPQAAFLVRCNDQGDFTSRNLDEFPGIYAVTRSGVPLSIVLAQAPAPEGAPGGSIHPFAGPWCWPGSRWRPPPCSPLNLGSTPTRTGGHPDGCSCSRGA
jgi:hypothetical protein